MATRRFLNLERRLDKQPELKQQYCDFIDEYERLGHLRVVEIDKTEKPGSVFYLPHHCILKPTSTTTKLRVVFDDALEIGPVVQRDLVSILVNFRGFRYVFTVDVPMMFRQIGVLRADRKYQLFLYRKQRDELLTVRELQTVTYGLTSSPFQATMVLNQIAEDYQKDFPEAARAIKKGADILAGADSVPEVCKLQQDVNYILAKGCFGVHKWCSNAEEIMNCIPEELRGVTFEVIGDNSNAVVKTLGVVWNPRKDWFSYCVTEGDPGASTRRKILSEVAKIF
ncbi:uncharacterized protein LOC135707614 [Ochlerotatus camptorhynchus]|uniref:uncharacterized protein LOC135707614 n=1 Tax=Ochlerotatus camptorhynchus TaxID=644619 RepID=UPI0031D681B2